jgi:hypothetical protein
MDRTVATADEPPVPLGRMPEAFVAQLGCGGRAGGGLAFGRAEPFLRAQPSPPACWGERCRCSRAADGAVATGAARQNSCRVIMGSLLLFQRQLRTTTATPMKESAAGNNQRAVPSWGVGFPGRLLRRPVPVRRCPPQGPAAPRQAAAVWDRARRHRLPGRPAGGGMCGCMVVCTCVWVCGWGGGGQAAGGKDGVRDGGKAGLARCAAGWSVPVHT